MSGVNKVILVGFLGSDPELTETKSNFPLCKVNLATTERRKIGDEWVPKTEWHRLLFLGKTAEILIRYCKKGKQLYIEGRLQTSSWEDRETGQKRYATEVLVHNMQMLGSAPKAEEKPENEFAGYGPQGEAAEPEAPQADLLLDDDDDDMDLPF